MAKENAGSYPFKDLKEAGQELERLKAQAKIGLPLERQIWQGLGLRHDQHVLDLACGPGITSCELGRIVKSGSVTGIDLSDELLSEAKKEAEQDKLTNVEFRKGNVYELELPENTYDFVYSRFLFQHLEEPEKALKEIYRVLKPGGTLCIVDVDDGFTAYHPEPEGFSELLKHAGETQKNNGGDRMIGRKLKTMLSNCKFQETKTDLISITTDTFGVEPFIDITTGFKAKQLGFEDESKTEQTLQKIYETMKQPNAWAVACVFVASGQK